MKSEDNDVEFLLEELRRAIDNDRFIPIDRDKNIQTLAKLGITWKDAKDEIYDLKLCNYIKGPEEDRDFPNEDKLWVFKKKVLGENIYIKFKIEYLKNRDAKILSFHIDEY